MAKRKLCLYENHKHLHEGKIYCRTGPLHAALVVSVQPELTHLVVAGHVRHTVIVSSQLVLDLVDGVILNVHGSDEKIVGDVVQVAAELQPGPSSTDVVGGALPLHLQRQKEGIQDQVRNEKNSFFTA